MSVAPSQSPISPSNTKGIFAVPAPPFHPTTMVPREWRPVVRCTEQLRLHPALQELGAISEIGELNIAARLKNQCLPEPILITLEGIIFYGIGRWRLAVFEGKHEIDCVEYALSEDESLRFTLAYHQTRSGWNAFVRIRLALALEHNLQQKALDNMRAGGKYKGSANLPEAQHVDVRGEIARIAGVSPRYVSNVKSILRLAHPRLTEALRDNTLTINRAIQFCELPRAEQLEQFIRYSEDRATNRVIRRTVAQPREEKASLDVAAALDALQNRERRQPGSVAVRVGRHKRTVVYIGQDLLTGQPSQKELKLT
jgi:hypothetical protein